MTNAKKILLIVSGVVVLVLVSILELIGVDKLCGGSQFTDCTQHLDDILIVFFPIIPLFVFTAISFILRKDAAQAWIKFVYWSIPLAMVLILMAPEYDNSLLPIEKGSVAFVVSVVFSIVSIGIFAIKSVLPKK